MLCKFSTLSDTGESPMLCKMSALSCPSAAPLLPKPECAQDVSAVQESHTGCQGSSVLHSPSQSSMWVCVYSVTEALPDSLEDVLGAAQQAAAAKAAGDMEQWQLHQDIILQRFGALLSHFVGDGTTQVCLLHPHDSDDAHADALLVFHAQTLFCNSNWTWLGNGFCTGFRLKHQLLSVGFCISHPCLALLPWPALQGTCNTTTCQHCKLQVASSVTHGAQGSSSSASMTDKQQAVRLRLGAHLGLALGYLSVPVPTTQAALNIRTEEDIQADPDPDMPHLNSSDDLPLQV